MHSGHMLQNVNYSFCFVCFLYTKYFNPYQTGDGLNMPTKFSNAYSSGTECRIDLKPGCKFELVRCPKDYKKN